MIIFLHLPMTFISNLLNNWYFQKINLMFMTVSGVELLFCISGYFLMNSLSKIEDNGKLLENICDFIVKKFKRFASAAHFWISVTLFFLFSK